MNLVTITKLLVNKHLLVLSGKNMADIARARYFKSAREIKLHQNESQ